MVLSFSYRMRLLPLLLLWLCNVFWFIVAPPPVRLILCVHYTCMVMMVWRGVDFRCVLLFFFQPILFFPFASDNHRQHIRLRTPCFIVILSKRVLVGWDMETGFFFCLFRWLSLTLHCAVLRRQIFGCQLSDANRLELFYYRNYY